MSTSPAPTLVIPPPSAEAATGGTLFRQLANAPEFAEFALILKQLTGLSMALNTPDVATTCIGVPGDAGNPLCALIRSTREGARRCESCDRRQHARAGADGEAKLYRCHAGFYDMAIPILFHREHVATISSGQVLPEPPSAAGFARLQQRLRWLGLPAPQLQAAYGGAPWMPRDRLAQVLQLLELFARQMCTSAWRLRELEASRERPALRQARAFVEAHYGEPDWQLADAAAAAGLSVAHFSHVFHQETGVTFTRYVQARRVTAAKHLLSTTTQSITEVCAACGFNSLTHFNRVFRRGTGCSPRQYRARLAAGG